MQHSPTSGRRPHPGTHDLVFLTLNNSGVVTSINQAGCNLLGWPAGHIIGKDWFSHFMPPEEGMRMKALFTRLIVTNPQRLERFETAVRTRTGPPRIIKWQNNLLYGDEGQIIGALGVGTDVSDSEPPGQTALREEREKRRRVLSAALEAQEQERKMIAEQLHEQTVQVLTTCKLLLAPEAGAVKAAPAVEIALRHLQQVIDDVRRLSHWLNPTQLSMIGLEAAIREMLQEIAPGGKPAFRVFVNEPAQLAALPPDLQLTLFRIVQEQGNNIIHHAAATKAQVMLYLSENLVELEISDNGRGFNPGQKAAGLGLHNIRSRAENHMGAMFLETSEGAGCILSVCLPLDRL